MSHYQDNVDLFVELESYRVIYENTERAIQVEKLYKETKDLKKADGLCKSFILKDKATKLLEESKINKRFMESTFEKFNAYDDIRKTALTKSKGYVENIHKYLKSSTNLIFVGYGSVGTGKTYLVSAIAKELMIKKGIPCKYINVVNLISKLKETFDITEYTDVEVLIIDDLGKEKGTPWVCEQLYSIINSRYELKKPTIITTENGIEDLLNNYNDKGKAIISRFCEDFILIKLTGSDYRKKRE